MSVGLVGIWLSLILPFDAYALLGEVMQSVDGIIGDWVNSMK